MIQFIQFIQFIPSIHSKPDHNSLNHPFHSIHPFIHSFTHSFLCKKRYIFVHGIERGFLGTPQILQDRGLNIPIIAQHQMSIPIHRQNRNFRPQLDHRRALIEPDSQLRLTLLPQSHLARLLRALHRPHAATRVVQRQLASTSKTAGTPTDTSRCARSAESRLHFPTR